MNSKICPNGDEKTKRIRSRSCVMKKIFKLAVLSASVALILVGCGGSSPSTESGQTGGNSPVSSISKRSNPIDDVKIAIEEVVGATKTVALMQNSPSKGWTSIALSASRNLTADDLDKLKGTIASKGYTFVDGGKGSNDPNDKSLGAAFSGDPSYVIIGFEPGKPEITATLVPAAEADKLLKEDDTK